MKLATKLFAATFGLFLAAPATAAPLIGGHGNYDGGRLSIQTQTGTSCSSSAPDRASIGIAAGFEDNNFDTPFGGTPADNGSLAGGVFIAIPFGGQDPGNCRQILTMEEQRTRLDMAVTLYEAGALTEEELKAVAEDVKRFVQ